MDANWTVSVEIGTKLLAEKVLKLLWPFGGLKSPFSGIHEVGRITRENVSEVDLIVTEVSFTLRRREGRV